MFLVLKPASNLGSDLAMLNTQLETCRPQFSEIFKTAFSFHFAFLKNVYWTAMVLEQIKKMPDGMLNVIDQYVKIMTLPLHFREVIITGKTHTRWDNGCSF